MQSNVIALIFGISIVGVVGSLVLIVFAWREWQRERRPKAEGNGQNANSRRGAPETGGPAAAAGSGLAWSDEAPASNPSVSPEGLPELLRVYEAQSAGGIVVELNGQRYRRVTDIRDGVVGQRLLSTLAALQRWVRAAQPDLSPEPQPVAPPQPIVSMPPPPASQPRPSKPAAAWQPIRAKAAPPKPGAAKSMIEAIDDILQTRLPGSPLAGRRINMRSAPDGSAQIVVDGRIYGGVSEVTDAAVREFIQAAVEAWERSV